MDEYVTPPIQIPASLLADIEKMGVLFDVGWQAHQLGLEIFERLQQNLSGGFETDYKMLVYVICSKAFMTFQAVRNLGLVGCGADALALSASLFENVVDLIYIKQAKVRRSHRYLQFEQVDKYYQVEKVLSRKRLPKGKRSRYRRYLSVLRPQVMKLLPKFRNQRANWSGKNLRERARAVGLDLEYDELYFICCGVKHTLPMGAAGFVFERDGLFDVVRGPNIKSVYLAEYYATWCVLNLFHLLQNAFSLTAEATQLAPVMKRLAEAAIEVRRTHPELCG